MSEVLASESGVAEELDRLRSELESQRREAEDKEAQLERYAADLRETFIAERAHAEKLFIAERAHAEKLRASYVATVRALTNAVEARDAYTAKHAERVAAYGLELAYRIDPELAANPQTEFGFLLHDVGKVAIPDGILNKDADLEELESELMQEHVMKGFEIVSQIPFLGDAAQIVLHHHEHYDGSGYPAGLRGEEIPLAARIFSVADTLDAMTTDRPYRPGASLADARTEIRAKAGTQFDPAVVAALDAIPDETLKRIGSDTE